MKPLHDRITSGRLMVVRSCAKCGDAMQVNVTVDEKNCIPCDIAAGRWPDLQAPGVAEPKK